MVGTMRTASAMLLLLAATGKAQNVSLQAELHVSGTSPCDHASELQAAMTATFCQPAEQKGSYGVRHWTMSAMEMCSKLTSGKCFTLDNMHCDGSPELCLKWDNWWGGSDAYAGRVLLPEGIRVHGWGSWSCEGQERFVKSGPAMHDFWDFSWRVDAFELALEEGYECMPSRSPPVQRKATTSTCTPDEIVGRWTYWLSQQSGDSTEHSIQVGLRTTETEQDTQTYTTSFGEKLTAGITVGDALAGGEGSFSAELSVSASTAISHVVSNTLEKSKVETETKVLTGAGTYWQFVMYATNSNSCHSHESQLKLPEYIRTPNVAHPPCCPPGLFKDIDDPLGDCVEGAIRLCQNSNTGLSMETVFP